MKILQENSLVSLLRPLTTEEYAALRTKLLLEGCTEKLPYAMIGGKPIQLDGHNRRKICAAERIAYDWKVVESVRTLEEARRWVRANQLGRRNLSAEELEQLREERRERVAEARQDGQSTRLIAERENVSERTVRNDLKVSGAEGSAPDGVVGKDGKRYSRTERNGRATFDWNTYRAHKGGLIRDLDDLGRAYHADTNTYQFEAIRRLIGEIDSSIKSLYKQLSKQPAPQE